MTLLRKMLMWMRQWRVAQAQYEYCEQQHERNMELFISGLGVLVVVATVIIVLTLCGCAHVEPQMPRIIRITEPVTIVELPSDWLYPRRGWCHPEGRLIYVRYESDSPLAWLLKRCGMKFEPQTDCYALGHEVKHLPEYDGYYHPRVKVNRK